MRKKIAEEKKQRKKRGVDQLSYFPSHEPSHEPGHVLISEVNPALKSNLDFSLDDSMPTSMASPRLSTRLFGVRKPAQVWTDAVPCQSPPCWTRRVMTGHR
jgi:hypothetical protein